MSFAPQRDWDFYRSIASQHGADVERTPEQRWRIYADFFNTIAQARKGQSRSSEFDRQRWEDKLILRRKTLVALQAVDQWNRERDTSDRSD